jgi:hypothetical protein
MARSNTQFERQVDIDRRIRDGEYPSCPELASVWEVDARTIQAGRLTSQYSTLTKDCDF